MKVIVVVIVMILSQQGYAGCEATIVEGRHTALTESSAKSGAWEEAVDACYPGDATNMTIQCEKVGSMIDGQNGLSMQCVQKVSCTVCGEDLTRKYEALD